MAVNGTNIPPKVMIKAVPRAYVDGENFELYINHFRRIARANEWSDEGKLAYLETKLSGKAQSQFDVFIEEEPGIVFEEMVEKLIEEMVPSSQKALEAFTAMRLEDRSPKEFYGALVRQSKLAHGEMNANGRHIVVRTQMLQILPKKLRQDAAKQGYLADMDKEDFLKVLTRVYDAELREEMDEVVKPYEPTIAFAQKSSTSVPERLEKLEKKYSQHEKDMSDLMGMVKSLCTNMQGGPVRSFGREGGGKQMRDQAGKSGNCFKCLEPGHFARECTNKVKCNKCLSEGHVRAACPKN